MIPQGGSLTDATVQEVQQPSLTWRLDFDRGRIVGRVDGLEAVRQAAFKALQTSRFAHAIYSFDYGHEIGALLGQNPLYVQSEVSRMISEALLQDDRIQSVEGIQVQIVGEQMTIRFAALTEYGRFEGEVNRDV